MTDPIKQQLEQARAAAQTIPPATSYTHPQTPGVNAAPQQPTPGHAHAPAASPSPQNYAQPGASAPVLYQPSANVPTQYAGQGQRLSVSNMRSSGANSLNVDHFIGVEKHGMVVRWAQDDPRRATLGQVAALPIVLLIDYAHDVAAKRSLRIQTPQGIKFYHSYDGVMMNDGSTPWNDFINSVRARDPQHKGDYASVDIAGVLVQPMMATDGRVLVEAGKRVGFSTSVMNWREYQDCHRAMLQQGLIAEFDDNSMEGVILMRVFPNTKVNRGGITYGVYNFECLGLATDDAVAAWRNAAPQPQAPAAGAPGMPPAGAQPVYQPQPQANYAPQPQAAAPQMAPAPQPQANYAPQAAAPQPVYHQPAPQAAAPAAPAPQAFAQPAPQADAYAGNGVPAGAIPTAGTAAQPEEKAPRRRRTASRVAGDDQAQG